MTNLIKKISKIILFAALPLAVLAGVFSLTGTARVYRYDIDSNVRKVYT